MSNHNTRHQQKQRDQRQQSDQAHHEVAATLMIVAKSGAPAPALFSGVHSANNNAATGNDNNSSVCASSSALTNQVQAIPALSRHHPILHYTTLFSSIGFGIDLAGNATEACCKALRDATDRGKLNTTPLAASQYQFHIQLGVPGLPALSPGVPQNIDTAKLAALLPSTIPKHFEVQCGGLLVPDSAGGGIEKASCVVVASVTLRQKHPGPPESQEAVETVGSPSSVTNSPAVLAIHHQPSLSPQLMQGYPVVPQVPSTWAEVEQMQQQQQQQEHRTLARDQQPLDRQAKQGPTRNKSIEMLARISAEMIGQEEVEAAGAHTSSFDLSGVTSMASLQQQEEDERRPAANFKKLPPGTTPKNHKRLFVKHTYRDHSHEVPLPEELDLVGPKAPDRTPNAAFPLKLHEILSQIEADGHDDIIGWLHHGRSFKIHKQKEFVDTVLPNYFVMTKKSSFLRQVCVAQLLGSQCRYQT